MSDEKGWESLVGEVLQRRGQAKYRGTLADLRKGANAETEHYAYRHVLPQAQEMSVSQQTALIRAIALTAQFPGIPQQEPDEKGRRSRCGASFAALSRQLSKKREAEVTPENPDAIAQRLRFIGQLDLEQAALTLRSILSLMSKAEIPLNWFDLVYTLLHWGNGITPESRGVRNRLQREYYLHLNQNAKKPVETTDKN